MSKLSDFVVIPLPTDKVLPGEMEIYSFTLPANLCHGEDDAACALIATFGISKAKNLRWEVLVNDATESQHDSNGDCVLTCQLFPEAAQFHPGLNQVAVYVKPAGKGLVEVKGLVIHFRVEV